MQQKKICDWEHFAAFWAFVTERKSIVTATCSLVFNIKKSTRPLSLLMPFGVFGSSPPSLSMSGVTWLPLSQPLQLLLLLRLFLFVSQGLFFASELREFSTAGRLGLLGDNPPRRRPRAEKMCQSEQVEQTSPKRRPHRCRRGSVLPGRPEQSQFRGFAEVRSLLAFIWVFYHSHAIPHAHTKQRKPNHSLLHLNGFCKSKR